MATIEQLLAAARADERAIANLKVRLSHARTYTERATLLRRIRYLEDQLAALRAQYLRAKAKLPATIFGTSKKPRIYAGLSIQGDISTDGRYFSNPAPKLANSARVWVRFRVDMAQKSPFSTSKTVIPEMIRFTWVIPRGYTVLDNYSKYGRVEPVVSLPLTVTREFKARSSGSTKANFGVYADPYFPVESDAYPPDGAMVEEAEVIAVFEPGSYYVYTRTSNVFSARTTITIPAEGAQYTVDEADERLFYTDGNTYLTLRLIESGPYSGKYTNLNVDGISLHETLGKRTWTI